MEEKVTIEKIKALIEKSELAKHEVKFAYTIQNLVKDAETLKEKIKSSINVAARFSSEYDKIVEMATKLGIELPANVIEAGKYVKLIEKLKL